MNRMDDMTPGAPGGTPDRTSNRLRVLVNGLHAKTGGGVTYMRHVLPVFEADPGLEVHLCLHEDQRPLFENNIGPGVSVHYAHFKSGFYRRLLWEQTALPLLARRIKAGVTFSPANFGPLLAPRPVILLRNALAVGEEESRFNKRLYWFFLSLMTRLSLVLGKRAIAVSSYARDALTLGVAPEVMKRVSVVHHGVDGMFSPPAPGDERENFLLCVGDIYIQKNLHTLAEALVRVDKRFPGVRLKVAGRPVDEDYGAMVDGILENNGLKGQVEFLGHVDAEGLAGLYRRCALFVQPSTVETFCNPLVEAMACGAPIASSNTTAMPEVVDGAALLFDPKDPKAMAECIVSALSDDSLRRGLSEKSAARAKDFSWDGTGRRTAAILKDCVAGEEG